VNLLDSNYRWPVYCMKLGSQYLLSQSSMSEYFYPAPSELIPCNWEDKYPSSSLQTDCNTQFQFKTNDMIAYINLVPCFCLYKEFLKLYFEVVIRLHVPSWIIMGIFHYRILLRKSRLRRRTEKYCNALCSLYSQWYVLNYNLFCLVRKVATVKIPLYLIDTMESREE